MDDIIKITLTPHLVLYEGGISDYDSFCHAQIHPLDLAIGSNWRSTLFFLRSLSLLAFLYSFLIRHLHVLFLCFGVIFKQSFFALCHCNSLSLGFFLEKRLLYFNIFK